MLTLWCSNSNINSLIIFFLLAELKRKEGQYCGPDEKILIASSFRRDFKASGKVARFTKRKASEYCQSRSNGEQSSSTDQTSYNTSSKGWKQTIFIQYVLQYFHVLRFQMDRNRLVNFFDKVIEIFSSIIFQNDLLIQEGMAQEEEKTKQLQEVIKFCQVSFP